MNLRRPIIILAILLIAGAGITWMNVGRTNIEAIDVELGAYQSPSLRSRTIDNAVLDALDRGSLNNELRIRLDKAERTVILTPFHIDECEVTQKDYEQFVEWTWSNGSTPEDPRPIWLRSLSSGHRTAGRLNSPASGVSHRGATMYCQAVGGRLPVVEELEAAARGQAGRLYPWGNEFDDSAWPYTEPDRNAQQACGTHRRAATPRGVQDLANNVMEWAASTEAVSLLTTPDQRPAFGAPPVRTRARDLYSLSAAWLPINSSVQSHHLGFRCVYDVLPPPVLPWGNPGGNTVSMPGGDFTVGIPSQARISHFVANLAADSEISLAKLLITADQTITRLRADKCEVSRKEYARFLADPLVGVGLYGNDNEPAGHSYEPLDWDEQQGNLDLPVVGVSWWSADAFARWSGGRLPSAEEWSAIAAGSEKRQFPWGDTYDPTAAATGDDASGRLVACDRSTDDRTREGIRHMAGNASEWTRSVTIDDGTVAMWVQGGNWMLPGEETTRTTFNRKVPLNHRTDTIGFRVVYD